jgi:uncharacterized membrane protein YphA (DoxX/SURF4 family)
LPMPDHMISLLLIHGPATLLALVFLYSAADKSLHWQEALLEIDRLGLPLPQVFVAATIANQFVGGVCMATGFCARSGAAVLAIFTVIATLLGHKFWMCRGQEARRELTRALEHLAIVGGLLAVVVQHVPPGSVG